MNSIPLTPEIERAIRERIAECPYCHGEAGTEACTYREHDKQLLLLAEIDRLRAEL